MTDFTERSVQANPIAVWPVSKDTEGVLKGVGDSVPLPVISPTPDQTVIALTSILNAIETQTDILRQIALHLAAGSDEVLDGKEL